MIRSYKVKHHANKSKRNTTIDLIKEYRVLAHQIANKQWRYFQEHYRFNKFAKLEIKNDISTAYKQTCQWQVVGTLDSYLSNIKNRFIEIVTNSKFDPKTKQKLYILNFHNNWYEDKLAKQILRHILKHWKKPTYKNYNLALDAKVAEISEDLTGLSHYPYWIKLSTLEKYKPIYIPISKNDYYENVRGKRKNFVHINLKDGELQFCFIKDKEKGEYTSKVKEIGLDTGLKFLFADDQGSLYGGDKFYAKLKQYDRDITKLFSRLQQNKLKTSKRYKRLVEKMRSWLKNEINRILNHIVEKYKPEEIKVEKLNFHHPKFSKQMNRLLRNFGKGYITAKLKDLEEKGIVISYVNPAYTSQECSNCGYVDADNRNDRDFVCKNCECKLHADVNAARNILSRSSGEEDKYVSRMEILRRLVDKFMVRNGRLISQAGRQHCLYSNPYYKSYYTDGVEMQI